MRAQELLDAVPQGGAEAAAPTAGPLSSQAGDGSWAAPAAAAQPAPLTQGDAANLDGCQVVARIDDQIILACDVLWRVNQLIETQKQKVGADVEVTDEQISAVRQQLMKREVAALVDRKLLFNEFRRNVPQENMPRIEENLRQPFNEKEMPNLMKQLKVNNQTELETELTRLGSSLADVRRSFNERVIAAEWIHSKVKVSEDVGPDEMMSTTKRI